MKKLALIFSFLFITIFSYQAITQATTPSYLGVSFLSKNEWEEKISDLTPAETGVIGHLVLFESSNLFYDASTFCHFITIGENNTGNFETRAGIALYWMGEFDEASAATMIANDEAFSLLAIYNGSYEVISLKISTLPLVSISTSEDAQVLTITNADDTQAGRYTTTSYLIEYHVRGNTSSYFSKKPYKVSLVDKNGNRQAETLFGLRNDDDWNFNAVYSDTTRIREATTSELIEQMSATNEDGTMHAQNEQFCELFIDGIYYGIYQVTEPMDTQQVEINENTDYLYKASGLYYFDLELYETYNAALDESELQIETESYPDSTFDTRYDYLIDYYTFIEGGQTEDGISIAQSSLSEIATVIDIENLIDLSVANTVFSLWDNILKNYMVVITEQENGSMLASREYFDFNYSFGDAYGHSPNDASYITATVSVSPEEISTDNVFLLFENAACSDEFIALYQARYTELRQDVLSEENILSVLDSYYTTLDNSGAYIRDTARWNMPNEDTAAAYEVLVNYTIDHLTVIDEYVATLSE